MTTTIDDTTPRVWVGCMVCSNEGNLVGDWFDAAVADEVVPATIHGIHACIDGHEELWCFDVENLPVRREMSPHEAARMARTVLSVDIEQRGAFTAWIASGDYTEDGDGTPSVSDFEERYEGHWESFREYAENLADDIGLLSDVPEEITRYFDWGSWTRDLAFDYTTEPAPDGSVYVFRVV